MPPKLGIFVLYKLTDTGGVGLPNLRNTGLPVNVGGQATDKSLRVDTAHPFFDMLVI